MAEAMTADGWAFEVRLALDLAAEARRSTAVRSLERHLDAFGRHGLAEGLLPGGLGGGEGPLGGGPGDDSVFDCDRPRNNTEGRVLISRARRRTDPITGEVFG